ncbi:hypothetical protein HON36_04350 [Candidatus Parcubacteria bacterium]|jgi:hypothetical protein|nr:hypothetical protein [Candidatus Parcubacteria bacterium]MBT7228487.1 hypothetical protein [Candidatus Parcubacteria bacterium]
MIKTEVCEQLKNEFKQVEEFKAEHDEIFQGIIDRGKGHIKFAIQRAATDLRYVLDNFYVDRELLKLREMYSERIIELNKTQNVIASKDMAAMAQLDNNEIKKQIEQKEYYFKRI